MSTFEEQFMGARPELPAVKDSELRKYVRYEEILREWNRKINLVSRRSLDCAFSIHFADSIFISDFSKKNQVGDMIDVGTGAGFPGVVLCIRHDVAVRLFERSEKKRLFLAYLKENLRLRIEVCGDFSGWPTQATIVARAVIPPQKLFSHLEKKIAKNSRIIIPFGKEEPSSTHPQSFKLVDQQEYDLPAGFGRRRIAVFERRST